MDKRIWRAERATDGACACCGRRHIHCDDCATLQRRVAEQMTHRKSLTVSCRECGAAIGQPCVSMHWNPGTVMERPLTTHSVRWIDAASEDPV